MLSICTRTLLHGRKTRPPTTIFRQRSKLLLAPPAAVKGGRSRMPGVLFTFSSICPKLRQRAGSSITITGPRLELPVRLKLVISIGTWSRPSPSVSAAAPLGGMSTMTSVGPATMTRSICPLGWRKLILPCV